MIVTLSEFFTDVRKQLEEGQAKYGETFRNMDQLALIREKIERFESTSNRGGNPEDLVKIAALAALRYVRCKSRPYTNKIVAIGSQTGETGYWLEHTGLVQRYLHSPEKASDEDWETLLYGASALLSVGYMHRIPDDVIERVRVYNLHPGSLPEFRGRDPHLQALRSGSTLTHATIHRVTSEIDGGPVLLKLPVLVNPGTDTAETLLLRLKIVGRAALKLFIDNYAGGLS